MRQLGLIVIYIQRTFLKLQEEIAELKMKFRRMT
jgi:hypothetical protein